MAKPIPGKIIKLIQKKSYRLSETALNRAQADCIDDYDIQEVFKSGYLWKKEIDEKKKAYDRYKYIIIGPGIHRSSVYTVGKIIKDKNGKTYYFIEIHRGS